MAASASAGGSRFSGRGWGELAGHTGQTWGVGQMRKEGQPFGAHPQAREPGRGVVSAQLEFILLGKPTVDSMSIQKPQNHTPGCPCTSHSWPSASRAPAGEKTPGRRGSAGGSSLSQGTRKGERLSQSPTVSPQHAHRRDAWRERDGVLPPRSEAGSGSGPTTVGTGLGLGRVSGLYMQCLWLRTKARAI